MGQASPREASGHRTSCRYLLAYEFVWAAHRPRGQKHSLEHLVVPQESVHQGMCGRAMDTLA
jgi:hypothetical protein